MGYIAVIVLIIFVGFERKIKNRRGYIYIMYLLIVLVIANGFYIDNYVVKNSDTICSEPYVESVNKLYPYTDSVSKNQIYIKKVTDNITTKMFCYQVMLHDKDNALSPQTYDVDQVKMYEVKENYRVETMARRYEERRNCRKDFFFPVLWELIGQDDKLVREGTTVFDNQYNIYIPEGSLAL